MQMIMNVIKDSRYVFSGMVKTHHVTTLFFLEKAFSFEEKDNN